MKQNDLLEESHGVDKDVTVIFELSTIFKVRDQEFPLSRFCVPLGVIDTVLQFDIVPKSVLVHYILEILEDLGRFRVILLPDCWRPCVLICHTRYVASTTPG